MAKVAIHAAEKTYGAYHAIRGVSIDIEDGEFLALVGPSGCGKSTLLRMIAGLEEITSGEIRIGGRLVNDVPSKDRDIAMVFQNYALYPHMTVGENMGFSLRLRGGRPQEIERKVRETAEILGLADLLDRKPAALSGGQRQRVAMGRAIVRSPQVFLFDEPLSNLDAGLRVQMRAEIKDLHRRLGTTSIYVTHDQVEAMTMADRIAVMRNGRIEQIGAPLDLYDRPSNSYVAGFIGSPAMNMLPGKPDEAGFLLSDGQRLVGVPGKPAAVTAGIRPEHVSIDPKGLAVDVHVVEPMGSETQIVGRLANQPFTAVLRDRIALRPGSRLNLSATRDQVHFFDAQGTRL